MPELDPRQQTILRAIIVEYIGTADPVGSEMIAHKYEIGVKSATVRNAMAEMSELGFLEQPHTSAGRIPSDAGYRYFVDNLMVGDLASEAKKRVADSANTGDALQAILRDTMRGLSHLTHLMGVATTVRDENVSARHAVLSAISSTQALLVLVLSNGHVENRMLEIPSGLTLDHIGAVNDSMQLAIAGKDLRTLSRVKTPTVDGNPSLDKLKSMIWSAVRAIAKDLTRGLMIIEGEEFMFGQPEFQRDLSSLNELLGQLKESDILYESIAPGDQAQTVTIGRENRHQTMRQLSIIRNSFFVGTREVGVVALVGPTRMRYETGIPLVNFTAGALSESLTRFLG
jgi:heat-inducible transcriptional repressor